MFKSLVTGITILALLGHALWGCCEHHHDTCGHTQFHADHDTLMGECHEEHAPSDDYAPNGHEMHDGDIDRSCPAGEESPHPTKRCELVRCVYIGPDVKIDCDFPVISTWANCTHDDAIILSAGSANTSHVCERDISPPEQRRHALLQHWLI